MGQWPDERIEAYKRYVEKDKEDIEKLEREYVRLQSAIRGTIERIGRIESSKGNYEGELYLQGWELKDNGWVRVYESQ
ncbi:hypothetical protein B7492_34200 (plasmid) [Bacillus mycoides]|uniref:Uncharacterized protein n=1 Tax=Bacillus mycoides TaxID=1405 RepID=A0A1W6AJT4_BACMY|nr:hypothetical protein [Bacillus mycoides]ARJ26084.1 hypothetical protein B7492_34200 [Bacillus mycoides]